MRERLFAVGIIGGVLAIALIAGWVFFFGRYNPSPPSLRDDPQPSIPGEILYIDDDSCMIVARASGEEYRELACRSDLQGATWLSDGRVLFAAYSTGMSGSGWWVIDPATREQTQVESTLDWYQVFGNPDYESPTGESATMSYNTDGDITVVGTDGQERVVYEVDGPDGYDPYFLTWSPDGRFLAMSYTRGQELWLIAADGSIAGTLADGIRPSGISWRIADVGVLPEMTRAVGGLK